MPSNGQEPFRKLPEGNPSRALSEQSKDSELRTQRGALALNKGSSGGDSPTGK